MVKNKPANNRSLNMSKKQQLLTAFIVPATVIDYRSVYINFYQCSYILNTLRRVYQYYFIILTIHSQLDIFTT